MKHKNYTLGLAFLLLWALPNSLLARVSQAIPDAQPITEAMAIDAPGHYELQADITGEGPLLTINAPWVSVDLKGHRLQSTTGNCAIEGAQPSSGLQKFVLKNGTVQSDQTAICGEFDSIQLQDLQIRAFVEGAAGFNLTASYVRAIDINLDAWNCGDLNNPDFLYLLDNQISCDQFGLRANDVLGGIVMQNNIEVGPNAIGLALSGERLLVKKNLFQSTTRDQASGGLRLLGTAHLVSDNSFEYFRDFAISVGDRDSFPTTMIRFNQMKASSDTSVGIHIEPNGCLVEFNEIIGSPAPIVETNTPTFIRENWIDRRSGSNSSIRSIRSSRGRSVKSILPKSEDKKPNWQPIASVQQIENPGYYYLTNDIQVSEATGSIRVMAPGVYLDLNGHRILNEAGEFKTLLQLEADAELTVQNGILEPRHVAIRGAGDNLVLSNVLIENESLFDMAIEVDLDDQFFMEHVDFDYSARCLDIEASEATLAGNALNGCFDFGGVRLEVSQQAMLSKNHFYGQDGPALKIGGQNIRFEYNVLENDRFDQLDGRDHEFISNLWRYSGNSVFHLNGDGYDFYENLLYGGGIQRFMVDVNEGSHLFDSNFFRLVDPVAFNLDTGSELRLKGNIFYWGFDGTAELFAEGETDGVIFLGRNLCEPSSICSEDEEGGLGEGEGEISPEKPGRGNGEKSSGRKGSRGGPRWK